MSDKPYDHKAWCGEVERNLKKQAERLESLESVNTEQAEGIQGLDMRLDALEELTGRLDRFEGRVLNCFAPDYPELIPDCPDEDPPAEECANEYDAMVGEQKERFIRDAPAEEFGSPNLGTSGAEQSDVPEGNDGRLGEPPSPAEKATREIADYLHIQVAHTRAKVLAIVQQAIDEETAKLKDENAGLLAACESLQQDNYILTAQPPKEEAKGIVDAIDRRDEREGTL